MDNPIQITCRHADLTDGIREAVNKKFKKLGKYFSGITRIHVILDISHVDRRKPKVDRPKVHKAEAVISLPSKPDLVVHKTSDDLYSSIDLLVDTLDRQLVKINKRMKDRSAHHTTPLPHDESYTQTHHPSPKG